MSNARAVLEFHRLLGFPMPSEPRPPTPETLHLRLTLLREEMAEVEEAAETLRTLPAPGAADLLPLAHELTDLLYVAYGALLALGIDPDATFAEIHRANMDKLGGPKRADGKQLKPEGWQPADLSRVLALPRS
ncbi:hypothetical protein [Deinococcus ruber]|uniref:HAD superfamily Cof-like phosphohydrolase n=1 Tax=Deinococcus ruber TaxID=1848197 RepID=A0A918CJL7_9DEIO|nr:hypothetical protein [Deinococcus ruber]GGR24613.1 hypothetical protein GCM10008957_40380 [Deinococcus ruber]